MPNMVEYQCGSRLMMRSKQISEKVMAKTGMKPMDQRIALRDSQTSPVLSCASEKPTITRAKKIHAARQAMWRSEKYSGLSQRALAGSPIRWDPPPRGRCVAGPR